MCSLSESRQFAVNVVQQLRAAGFQALWAGGCVRDVLMGNDPHDYDVATSATPQQVRDVFGFKRTLMVGASFGVVIVKGATRLQEQVEVATFRTDASYSDGRRPDAVTFSTPEKDAERRDFTINGMFLDPITDEVIDYVGGREDLRSGVIRAIGDPHARLAEDKLRMLRAVRFAARFGFDLDPATEQAVTAHAADVALVSGERIAVELRKTLETDRAVWAVEKLQQTGLLRVIAPQVSEAWDQIGVLVCKLLGDCADANWLVRASALIWPLASVGRDADAIASEWKQRLRLANDEADALAFSVSVQPLLAAASTTPWSIIQPQLIKPHIRTALGLLRARAGEDPTLAAESLWIEERLRWSKEQLDPAPLLDGASLLKLGLKPSPMFREVLQCARAMQLDGELIDRPAALEWLRKRTGNIEGSECDPNSLE